MRTLLLCAAATLGLGACEPETTPRDRLSPEARRRVEALESIAEPTTEQVIELAELLRAHGLVLEAADRLEMARRRSEDSAEIHAALAEIYMELGYGRAVLRELNGCLRNDPRRADCLEIFARVLERDGTPASLREARRVYTVFLELAPDHPRAKRARSALEQLGGPLAMAENEDEDEDEDVPALAGIPELTPGPSPEGGGSSAHPSGTPSGGSAPSLNEFGQALADAFRALKRGEPAEAEAAFRRALDLKPNHAATRAGLAEALVAQGQVAEAVKTIEAAYADAPGDAQVRLVYGSVMLQAGDRREEALAAWEALVKDTPEVAERYGIPERLAALRRGGGGTVARPPAQNR